MSKSSIEWTEHTANPVIGCSKCSPACDNCYALAMARRLAGMKGPVGDDYRRVVTDGEWNGETVFIPEVLDKIIKRKKPTTYFFSMTDIFHESVPKDWLDQIMATIAMCPQHRFMVLTKRPTKMRDYMMRRGLWLPLPNLALGVSVWDQESADHAIPLLLQTPAARRFVSAEPLLGPVDLRFLQPSDPPTEINALNGTYGVLRPHGGKCDKLDLVIVGGEAGPKARPMHPNWARSLRDQCAAAGVQFMFKGWGNCMPCNYDKCFIRVGKKAAGRTLDGVEHNGAIQWEVVR